MLSKDENLSSSVMIYPEKIVQVNILKIASFEATDLFSDIFRVDSFSSTRIEMNVEGNSTSCNGCDGSCGCNQCA